MHLVPTPFFLNPKYLLIAAKRLNQRPGAREEMRSSIGRSENPSILVTESQRDHPFSTVRNSVSLYLGHD